MRMLNTARHTFMFLAKCPTCPAAKFVWAVAWRIPEATFDGQVVLRCRASLPCIVCLAPMEMCGAAVELAEDHRRHLVSKLGREPAAGSVLVL